MAWLKLKRVLHTEKLWLLDAAKLYSPSPKWVLLVSCYEWATQEEGFPTLCFRITCGTFWKILTPPTPFPHRDPDTGDLGSALGICNLTKCDVCFWCKVGKGNCEIKHLIYVATLRERNQTEAGFVCLFVFKQSLRIVRDLKGHPAKWHLASSHCNIQMTTYRDRTRITSQSSPCHCWKVLIAGKFHLSGVKSTFFHWSRPCLLGPPHSTMTAEKAQSGGHQGAEKWALTSESEDLYLRVESAR